MKITKKLLRKWGACWTDKQIGEKLGTRKSMSPREVAADETISASDRLWVLAQCLAHLDESAARGFAVECAMTVAHLAPDEDEHRGLLNDILQAEDLPTDRQGAAYSAAYSAAESAAYSAAYSAAESAADAAWSAADAAWSAASAAAYSAADSAAYSAAGSAAYGVAYGVARSAAESAAYSAASAAYSAAVARALAWLGSKAD